MKMTIEAGYHCKECGSPAMIIDGKIVRSCAHTGTVVAECSAHVTANGGLAVAAAPASVVDCADVNTSVYLTEDGRYLPD